MMKYTENPKTKAILALLGAGVLLTGIILVPNLPVAAKPFIDFYYNRKRARDLKEWNRFNPYRLRQILRRLYQQRVVEVINDKDGDYIKLTDKGKVKFLKYNLEEMMLEKPPKWDGKWRLIIYDVRDEKKFLGEFFRRMLKKMEFLKLQKSVYLTPYPCNDQIQFLRGLYNLDEEVLYLEVNRLENEQAYKVYFGL